MEFVNYTVGQDDSERRLDRVLRKFLSEENISSLYKSLRKGLVKVDGKKCDGNFRLQKGSIIQIADFLILRNSESIKSKTADFKMTESDFQDVQKKLKAITLFRNETLLILNKPYDIPVQPASSSKIQSLSELVQAEYEFSHKNSSLSFKTGPLHRLDRKTTGLIAFSQNLEGAKWFSDTIKNHLIQKKYLAILEGNLQENQIWEDKIEKNNTRTDKTWVRGEKSGKFHTVTVNSTGGKIAHTEVFPICHDIFDGREITLAEVIIKTGRTHQIRSQSAYHGFPLLGDSAYGSKKIDSKRVGRDFFLHAAELTFPKPNPLGLPEKLIAPPPPFFKELFPEFSLSFR